MGHSLSPRSPTDLGLSCRPPGRQPSLSRRLPARQAGSRAAAGLDGCTAPKWRAVCSNPVLASALVGRRSKDDHAREPLRHGGPQRRQPSGQNQQLIVRPGAGAKAEHEATLHQLGRAALRTARGTGPPRHDREPSGGLAAEPQAMQPCGSRAASFRGGATFANDGWTTATRDEKKRESNEGQTATG